MYNDSTNQAQLPVIVGNDNVLMSSDVLQLQSEPLLGACEKIAGCIANILADASPEAAARVESIELIPELCVKVLIRLK